MPAPLVSVVIASYNRAHVLSRALRSVERQTYRDYEVIVVDDGSHDGTPEVLRTFGSRVRCIVLERNRGQAAARNRGVAEAQGEYIAFLDADDEWTPTKLEKQVACFASAPPEVAFVTTAYELVGIDGRHRAQHPREPKEGDLSGSLTDFVDGTTEIVGVFSTLMFRRAALQRVGQLDESLACWEDGDFYLRAAAHFEFRFIPEALTIKHDSADSVSFSRTRAADGVRTFWRKHRGQFGSSRAFCRYIARHQHSLAVQACLAGEIAEGRRLFRESVATWPWHWRPLVHLGISLAGPRVYSGAVARRRR